jgi:lauroyl/myristoyl acyltransferase
MDLYEWIGRLTRNERRLERWGGLLSLLPRPLILLGCYILSRLLAFRAKPLCHRIEANMRDLLGASPSVAQLRKRYLFNVCVTLYELLIDSGRLRKSHGRRFLTEGEQYLEEALAMKRGAIVYAPHMGNFFLYYWYLSQRYPCLTVATAKSAELRPLYLMFQRLGCSGLDYDETPPLSLVRTLRRHLEHNGVVFLMGDFWRPEFPDVPMFGRATRLPLGAVTLSLDNQVPVIPFFGYRESGFRHRLVFGSPLSFHNRYKRDQAAEVMKPLIRFLEDAIRALPEQWLYWFNADERWLTEARKEWEGS